MPVGAIACAQRVFTSLHLPGSGIKPGAKSKGQVSGPAAYPGLDMGLLFKFARNQLFPQPASGFKVDNQRQAFAVLTDFGDASLKELLDKSFYTVRASTPAQHLHTSLRCYCAARALTQHL